MTTTDSNAGIEPTGPLIANGRGSDHVGVTFRGATRIYAKTDVPALEDFDLEVRPGEFMVLVGPSGSGKSTALRMLAGLEGVDDGQILIGARDVTKLPPKQRDIAMVFQDYALYPHMTVAENIGFHLKIGKVKRQEVRRRVAETADLLGLGPFLERRPANLSGGQRQRVAMGRAIIRHPKVFLMDEPLSNLDAKLRTQTRNEIARLQRRLGVTTIYVTHDQVEAMTLGQRVCVLRDGRLQQVDTPQELFRNPANLFVAGFIGSPAMNFATADLVRDDGPAVTFAGYKIPVHADVISSRKSLDKYFGKEVIAGIRPSDFEEGTFADASWARIPVTADVTEELGSEIHVIFGLDTPPVEHPSISDARTGGADDEAGVTALVGGKSLWTARVSARSEVRPGATIELGVDTRRLHFFDPATGLAIT